MNNPQIRKCLSTSPFPGERLDRTLSITFSSMRFVRLKNIASLYCLENHFNQNLTSWIRVSLFCFWEFFVWSEPIRRATPCWPTNFIFVLLLRTSHCITFLHVSLLTWFHGSPPCFLCISLRNLWERSSPDLKMPSMFAFPTGFAMAWQKHWEPTKLTLNMGKKCNSHVLRSNCARIDSWSRRTWFGSWCLNYDLFAHQE